MTILQSVNPWLNHIIQEYPWMNRQQAHQTLLTLLHQVRDSLGETEAIQLGQSLPIQLQALYFENWHASQKQRAFLKKHGFATRSDWLENDDSKSRLKMVESLCAEGRPVL